MSLRQQSIGFFEDDGLMPVTAETRAAVRMRPRRCGSGLSCGAVPAATLEHLRKLWWTFFVQCGAMFYEPEDSRQTSRS